MYSFKNDIVHLFYILSHRRFETNSWCKNTIQIKKLALLFESLVRSIFQNNDKEYFQLIQKLILYTRDILYGKGEQYLSYMMITAFYKYYPEDAMSLVNSFVYSKCNENGIYRPPYGCWRDMKHICSYAKNMDPIASIPLIKEIMNIINKQLYDDLNNKTKQKSLVAKWIPREKSKYGWLFCELAIHWAKKHTPYLFYSKKTCQSSIMCEGSIIRRNNLCYSNYRKIVSMLNSLLDTVEIKQCSHNWKNISPERINIGTLIKQKTAFFSDKNLDRIECSNKLHTYFLVKVIEKEKEKPNFIKDFFSNSYFRNKSYKIDISFFVKEAIQINRMILPLCVSKPADNFSNFDFFLNKLEKTYFLENIWNHYKNNCYPLENVIPIVDISLSMNASNMIPYYNAIGIACLLASKSSFKNRIITIDHQPSWINLDDCLNLCSMIKKIIESSKGGTRSDIFESIELIIQSILITNMTPEQVGKMVFVVLSDMNHINFLEETHQKIEKLFQEAGLKSIYKKSFTVPHIIYWNLSNQFLEYPPCLHNTPRVSLLSGSSQSLINDFCFLGSSSHLDEYTFDNPFNVIRRVLCQKRYDI